MANKDLHALVDMGSNGIRFSITDLGPDSARGLPQIHHHRAPISLHDAQFPAGSSERRPLSENTIDSVIAAFKSFQRVCDIHGVPKQNIKVVATEATRTAPNSADFLAAIKGRVGWQDINLLPKEEEARLGAFGIAASVPLCRGLVLDLGGGSVQLSWVRTKDNGSVPDISDDVVSLPYGAAALMKRLEGGDKKAMSTLQDEVTEEMVKTLKGLNIPEDLRDHRGHVPVFLSGGGFRGWGYLLMASHPDGEHPMQMISGYSVDWDEFTNFKRVEHLIKKRSDAVAKVDSKKAKKGKADMKEDTGIHRISARRLYQLPAIKLVVAALEAALKKAKIGISQVTFCAGGVPAGLLFTKLESEARARNALTEATASTVTALSADTLNTQHVEKLFEAALPAQTVPRSVTSIAPALAGLLNAHSALPKDIRAAAALRYPITGSIAMSSALGIDHAQRAALGLALCARWGGESELPELDHLELSRIRAVLGAAGSWWVEVLGRLAALVADLAIHGGASVTKLSGSISQDAQARETLRLDMKLASADASVLGELKTGQLEDDDDAEDEDGNNDAAASSVVTGSGLSKAVKTLEKIGKKKKWITVVRDGRPSAYGMRVGVVISK